MNSENDHSSKILKITTSLKGLQSDEQRNVLNIVDQLRKCGLESMLFLSQLVVCDDQSVGKSSVLETLTEIPFPRNDNLCTRFVTEIILRRATSDAITIKVISDHERSNEERNFIEAFKKFISNFEKLSDLMNKATSLMRINNKFTFKFRTFVKDVLSIEIEDSFRFQLTLVDLFELVQTQIKEVTEENVQLVTEIIDQYISQSRTICLTVISATNDYANQDILKKVRKMNSKEDRTLDIITKFDRLSAGSESEKAFLELTRNENIFFKLGWHVLKNRTYEEDSSSFEKRNLSESRYFRKSNFATLSKDCVDIDSLRNRLSQLLFNHVKQKLSKLRKNLEKALTDSRDQLKTMSDQRVTLTECRIFLMQLSLNFYEIGKAAVNEHYEEDYFIHNIDSIFSLQSLATIRRLRIVIQYMNSHFFNSLRTRGHKYHIDRSERSNSKKAEITITDVIFTLADSEHEASTKLFKSEALR